MERRPRRTETADSGHVRNAQSTRTRTHCGCSRARTTAELREGWRDGHPRPAIEGIRRLDDVGLLERRRVRPPICANSTGGGARGARARTRTRGPGGGARGGGCARKSWRTRRWTSWRSSTQRARRAISLARFDRPTQRRRLYAYLARRGYSADDIRRALERIAGADSRGVCRAADRARQRKWTSSRSDP